MDRDRRYSIDAAIVRTMKSRKVMQHQQVGIAFPPACYWQLKAEGCWWPPKPQRTGTYERDAAQVSVRY